MYFLSLLTWGALYLSRTVSMCCRMNNPRAWLCYEKYCKSRPKYQQRGWGLGSPIVQIKTSGKTCYLYLSTRGSECYLFRVIFKFWVPSLVNSSWRQQLNDCYDVHCFLCMSLRDLGCLSYTQLSIILINLSLISLTMQTLLFTYSHSVQCH